MTMMITMTKLVITMIITMTKLMMTTEYLSKLLR